MENCLASPQMISEKKGRKKINFLKLKKDISIKKKVNFLLDILNLNFVLSLKKFCSLAHREVPQICVGSAARNTLAAHCTVCARGVHRKITHLFNYNGN
jgi:hypothetical protein